MNTAVPVLSGFEVANWRELYEWSPTGFYAGQLLEGFDGDTTLCSCAPGCHERGDSWAFMRGCRRSILLGKSLSSARRFQDNKKQLAVCCDEALVLT